MDLAVDAGTDFSCYKALIAGYKNTVVGKEESGSDEDKRCIRKGYTE